MGQSINLVPREIKTEQVKVRVVKASSVVTVLMLIIVGGISGYFYYNNLMAKSKIKENEAQIASLRKDIQEMEDIEVVARNLDKKYSSIKDVLDNRLYYSMLMEEVKSRIPEGVILTEFILNRDGTISLDGYGQTYLSISEFFGNLGVPSSEEGVEPLFGDVTLNSVSFDNRDGTAKYSITTKFNGELLKK